MIWLIVSEVSVPVQLAPVVLGLWGDRDVTVERSPGRKLLNPAQKEREREPE